jgi:hypothetical protein
MSADCTSQAQAVADELAATLPQAPSEAIIARTLRVAYLRGFVAALEADREQRRRVMESREVMP